MPPVETSPRVPCGSPSRGSSPAALLSAIPVGAEIRTAGVVATAGAKKHSLSGSIQGSMMFGVPPASSISQTTEFFPYVIEFTSGSGSLKPLGKVRIHTTESFIAAANPHGPSIGIIALTNPKGKVIAACSSPDPRSPPAIRYRRSTRSFCPLRPAINEVVG